jgi:hypothetical protein
VAEWVIDMFGAFNHQKITKFANNSATNEARVKMSTD